MALNRMMSKMETSRNAGRGQDPGDALLYRIKEGDQEALALLYRQTASAVYGFALSILKNRESAEDVMQDTFVQIFKAAGTYTGRGKPMAWILTITRNLAYMKLRSVRSVSDTPAEELRDLRDPADLIENSQNRILLESVLARLSDEERQIVILYAVTGLRHREIASLLELPLSTVLSKYRRTLQKMKQIMEDGSNE